MAVTPESVNSTWLGMTILQSRALAVMIAGLLATFGVIFTWYAKYFSFLSAHQPFSLGLIAALLTYILCFSVGPQMWRRYRQARRDAITLVENTEAEQTKHFRLDPYITPTPQEFQREDGAHNEVLRWIRETTRPVLFLSGMSGSGKSSVLEAYVLPNLQAGGWRIERVRSFGDPLPMLEAALTLLRPRGKRLLVVFDQFEEFIIIEDRSKAEERYQFLKRVRELQQAPPPGLCLLFSFRRDYMSDVVSMKIEDLVPLQSFMEIDAFRRNAARQFLERAPEAPGPELVTRLLAGAEALDDVPARFRPITLNMLGLALKDFDRLVTGRPERLVQQYMEAAIAQPDIKDIAPRVVEKLITDASTKKPCTVTELAEQTGFREQDILACLILLANRGLVRRLDAAQNLWAVSHDFVARQFALLLGKLRPSLWPKVAMFGAPVLFAVALCAIMFAIPIYVRNAALTTLSNLDISVKGDADHRLATFPQDSTDSILREAMPNLVALGVRAMDLSNNTEVTMLPPLHGLSALRTLNLSNNTEVTTLAPLQGLAALQTLDLSNNTKLATLPPLQGLTALQTLDLSNTRLTTLPALQGLTALQALDVSYTALAMLPPLRGLTALRTLDLSNTKLATLPPLQGLTKLQTLDLRNTRLITLPSLQGLAVLKVLSLSGTDLTTLPPLQGFRTLQTLNLSNTRLATVPPLQAFTELEVLNLSNTKLATLPPLQGLTALQMLNLRNTRLTILPSLLGLTALQMLDVSGTDLATLPPLQGLTALQVLKLSYTDLVTLPPPQGLTMLQTLDLANTKLATLPQLQGLTALQVLDLSGTQLRTLTPLLGLSNLKDLNLDGSKVAQNDPVLLELQKRDVAIYGTLIYHS